MNMAGHSLPPACSPGIVWSCPPDKLTLRDNEVHVWRAALDRPALQIKDLWQTLAAEEKDRAERFFSARDRRHFIVARGLLRMILGRYLARAPQQLQFCYNPYGKPTLVGQAGADRISFNLSHSHKLILYAITRNREIGVDLEYIRHDCLGEPLAERFFAPQEVAALRELPAHLQAEAFFNCWTRKEAYIKARGQGLALPLSEFVVSLVPSEPAALLSVKGAPLEATTWSLQALAPGPGYAAALAIAGGIEHLSYWQWPHGPATALTS